MKATLAKGIAAASLFAVLPVSLLAQSELYPGHFDLEEVRLLDSPFLEAMKLNDSALFEYDADRLLTAAVVQAGLNDDPDSKYYRWKESHPVYPIWYYESSVPHYVSSLALACAASSDETMKMRLKERLLCSARFLTVGPGLKSGIKLRLDNPAQLGAELLCGAVAALTEGPGPLAVISADTAISIMAVNAKQELVGGVILPGPQLSLSALVQRTAQLPQIDLSAPASSSILGKNTSACLQNGFVLGTAGLLDGLAERFQAELGPDIRFYATGNLPRTIREACRTPIEYREYLITDGLYRIWQKNRKG